MPDVTPIPKAQERQSKAEFRNEYPTASADAAARSQGQCEARIEGCAGRATQVHHRGLRGWKGCNTPVLLLAVCGNGAASGCHFQIHSRPGWARRHGFLTVRGDINPMAPVPCPLSCEEDHR